MNTLLPKNAAEAVANGAQLLDEKVPGWYRKIDLSTLNVRSGEKCVCGQLRGSDERYNEYARSTLGVYNVGMLGAYGFTNWYQSPTSWSELFTSYDDLTTEWKQVIQARLDADALVVEEKEAVLA